MVVPHLTYGHVAGDVGVVVAVGVVVGVVVVVVALLLRVAPCRWRWLSGRGGNSSVGMQQGTEAHPPAGTALLAPEISKPPGGVARDNMLPISMLSEYALSVGGMKGVRSGSQFSGHAKRNSGPPSPGTE